MHVIPAVQHGSAMWAHHHDAMLTLGIWTEKIPGRGEDAEPLVVYHDGCRLGLLAVCDGVGGAGVQMAGHTHSGMERSGAWVSSRAVRLAAEQYFVRLARFAASPDVAAALDTVGWERLSLGEWPSLRANIDDVLQQLRNPVRRRIGGTMQRELPTTLAAILYHLGAASTRFQVRWAGDSRCYLLTPQHGLQQLSRDDTELPDALRSLEQDPPMTNQITADRNYDVHCEEGQVPGPCILLCATDGFFNYVQTPAHFEYILLHSLASSTDLAGWGELLVRTVQGYTQDDATLALVTPGYRAFAELRQAFAARLAIMREEHWQPFQGLGEPDDGAYRAARLSSWQQYRTQYEQRIPLPPEAR
jgi:serine/threonine protein phosphatase PrpC